VLRFETFQVLSVSYQINVIYLGILYVKYELTSMSTLLTSISGHLTTFTFMPSHILQTPEIHHLWCWTRLK